MSCLPPEEAAARDARIAELTLAGYSAAEIATQIGITARTVVRARSRTGASRPCNHNNYMTPAEMARAEALLDDGASLSEVARTLGRSTVTLSKWFPGRGWPRGSGVELRRMMAALDAIPDNIVTLRRRFRDPACITVVPQLRRMSIAFNAIPAVAS